MAWLNTQKLHVRYIGDATETSPTLPRCYTLTHSDRTGELFFSIGTDYDRAAISGFYTRLMRDEVLAEYQKVGDNFELHVFCHVSGGFVVGPAGWRFEIFKYHLPDVLQAFRYGDALFIEANPGFGNTPIRIHFKSTKKRFDMVEDWGSVDDYQINL